MVQSLEVCQEMEQEKQRLARVPAQEKEKGRSNEEGGDCRMTNDKQKEDLIPKEVVLEDVELDDGIVSSGARAYYRTHYATEEEKRAMDKQDKLDTIGAVLFYLILIALVVTAVILEVFE